MVVSFSLPRGRRLLSPLVLLLAAVALLAPSAPSAKAGPSASATRDAPVLLARAGAGTHSFSRGRSSYGSRRYGYGYRRTGGHSFLHGLFVGWTLSHFFGFGGGVPLFPLLFIVLIMYLLLRGGGRRRPPRRGGPWLQS
jgi:uncharacterized membrane protein